MKISDIELIGHIRAGNSEMFDLLAMSHGPRIFTIAKGVMCDVKEAENVLQHVFLRALSELQNFRRGNFAFDTWLYKIALNTIDKEWNIWKEPTTVNIDDYLPQFDSHGKLVSSVKPASMNATNGINANVCGLKEAIAQLPYEYRIVVVAVDVAGLSTQDSAEALRLPVPAVKTRLHRARLFLVRRAQAGDFSHEKHRGGGSVGGFRAGSK